MIENIVNVFEQSRGQAGFIKKGDSWYFNEAETILVANLQKSNFGKQYYVNLAVYVKQFGEERFSELRHDLIDRHLNMGLGMFLKILVLTIYLALQGMKLVLARLAHLGGTDRIAPHDVPRAVVGDHFREFLIKQ